MKNTELEMEEKNNLWRPGRHLPGSRLQQKGNVHPKYTWAADTSARQLNPQHTICHTHGVWGQKKQLLGHTPPRDTKASQASGHLGAPEEGSRACFHPR